MKKPLLILTILVSLVVLLIFAFLIVAFAIVKPTTDRINRSLAAKFASVVTIPQIPPQARHFEETVYFWEMETPQKEVVGVKFTHNTLFPKNQGKMEASLEIVEGGDPSIFTKVLPAVVSDEQSLISALDIEKANFEAGSLAPYTKFQLFTHAETKQTIKIRWDFKKEPLLFGLEGEYQKIHRIPQPILNFIYNFQKLTFDILSE